MRRIQEDIDELITNDALQFTKDLLQEGILTMDNKIECKNRTLYIDDRPQVYFVALSTSTRKKSQSYADVNQIVFDEVFESVGKRKYLKDEVSLFLEFYETVNRLRIDGRPEVRVFFLSNKTTFINPYFSYFGITPFADRFKTFKDGLIVVENYSNEKFIETKKNTKFGRLISGTKYGDYAIENQVWFDDDAFIEKRPANAKPLYQFRVKERFISLYFCQDNEILYVCEGKSTGQKFSIKYECLDGELPLAMGRYPLKTINDLFHYGMLRFDNNVSKGIMFELLQTAGLQ